VPTLAGRAARRSLRIITLYAIAKNALDISSLCHFAEPSTSQRSKAEIRNSIAEKVHKVAASDSRWGLSFLIHDGTVTLLFGQQIGPLFN
jgi:hypothetical protein